MSKMISNKIAVIGLSIKAPGANDQFEFWENLKRGGYFVREVPNQRWSVDAVFDPKPNPNKSYCKWGGFLENVDFFEPRHFGISSKDADSMDPQQRLFLESVWGLLEDAGYTQESISRNTGVFVGAHSHDYALYAAYAAYHEKNTLRNIDLYQIPNRISHSFNLMGPSLAVDSACASSGTALHLARQSLLSGECDTAIVGGVNLFLHPSRFVQLSQMSFFAKNEYIRPFDQQATGTLFSEAVVSVLLKPLDAAIRDGDNIYATILGSASNNDGKTWGFTVPNPEAQTQLVSQALASAAVPSSSISYVEAHGTGTVLGDPAEVKALTRAYKANDTGDIEKRGQYCGIGSAKSNVGHAESAAAVVGLAKVLLQFRHSTLVPTINIDTLNRLIKFEKTPFYPVQKLQAWQSADSSAPRRAGLSSFGAGGSNTHFILEENVPTPRSSDSTDKIMHALPFSANDAGRLPTLIQNLAAFLSTANRAESLSLTDIAYTLQLGRETLKHKTVVVVTSIDELVALSNELSEVNLSGETVFPTNADRDQLDPTLRHCVQTWLTSEAGVWNSLYETKENKPRRISLPTYPFQGKPHGLPAYLARKTLFSEQHQEPANHVTCTRIVIDCHDPILKQHVMQGVELLPGAAALTQIVDTVAQMLSIDRANIDLALNWLAPAQAATPAEDLQIDVELDRTVEPWTCRIVSSDKARLFATGLVSLRDHASAAVDKFALPKSSALASTALHDELIYWLFQQSGTDYGPLFQGIKKITVAQSHALVTFNDLKDGLLKSRSKNTEAFVLDGLFQATIAYTQEATPTNNAPYLPVTIKGLSMVGQLLDATHATIKPLPLSEQGSKLFALALYDRVGNLLFSADEFKLQQVQLNLQTTAKTYLLQRHKEQSMQALLAQDNDRSEIRIKPGIKSSDPARHVEDSNGICCIDWYAPDPATAPNDYLQSAALNAKRLIEQVAKSNGPVRITYAPSDANDHAFSIERGIEALVHSLSREFENVSFEASGLGYATHELSQRSAPVTDQLKLRDDSVYIIGGGSGKLGLMVGAWIAQRVKSDVILCGRRPVSSGIQSVIDYVSEKFAGRLFYRQIDLTDADQVAQFVEKTNGSDMPLRGIINCAGVILDSVASAKTVESISSVLRAKLQSTINLDIHSKSAPLDFFIAYSSIAALIGPVGQSDYALANGLLDEYILARIARQKRGERCGRSYSINWPLWRSGGMSTSPTVEKILHSQFGLIALPTNSGLRVLDQLNSLPEGVVSVAHGEAAVIGKAFGNSQTQQSPSGENHARRPEDTTDAVIAIMAKSLMCKAEELSESDTFEELGLDSLNVTEITYDIEKIFGILLTSDQFVKLTSIGKVCEKLHAESTIFNIQKKPADAPPTVQAALQNQTTLTSIDSKRSVIKDRLEVAPGVVLPFEYHVNDQAFPTILIFHGWLMRNSSLSSLYEDPSLRARFNFLVFEHEGQINASKLDDKPAFDIAQNARYVSAIINKIGLGGEQIHLMGISTGSNLLTEFAYQFPANVKSIMFVGPYFLLEERQKNKTKSYIEIGELLDPTNVDKFIDMVYYDFFTDHFSEKNADVIRFMRSNVSELTKSVPNILRSFSKILRGCWDYADLLASRFDFFSKQTFPIRIILGEQDRLVSVSVLRDLVSENGAEIQVVRGMGHVLFVEADKYFKEKLINFFSEAKNDYARKSTNRINDMRLPATVEFAGNQFPVTVLNWSYGGEYGCEIQFDQALDSFDGNSEKEIKINLHAPVPLTFVAQVAWTNYVSARQHIGLKAMVLMDTNQKMKPA